MKAENLNPKFESLINPISLVNHINEIKETTETIDDKLKKALILPTEKLEPPKIAWGQIAEKQSRILGTLGNFALIIGKAKSKKSFFVNIAVSTVLKNDSLLGMFKGELPEDKKKVLYFDTEQGKYHVQKALRRICEQIKVTIPKNLMVYGLRSYSPSERLAMIEKAIEQTENLGFVIIDGIKDLVTSINDEEQATMITTKLMSWSENKNIHILTVLHQNKGDNNARGHIGTELINKAETVLSVTRDTKNPDISIVEAQFCRDIEPIPFAFEILNGLPCLVSGFEITKTKTSGFDLLELDKIKQFQILNSVFSKQENFKYSELVLQVKTTIQVEQKQKIGDNKVKSFLTYCKNNHWLIQEAEKKPYTLGKFKEEN